MFIISWQDKICIFLINSISVLVFLTYCYHYLYPYSCYCYYCYCFYYFIIITTIFYCCYSHYYCSQYFISMLFILSHFISYCSYYYDLSVCRVCDMYISSNNFVFFPLLMIYILHSYCLYMLRIIFLLSLSFIWSLSQSLSESFFFFNTTSHWGRNQQMNLSGMVCPYSLITLGKP